MEFDSEHMRAEDLQAYLSLVEALNNNTLTVDKVRDVIVGLRDQAQAELAEIKDVPQTWLSVLSFFIPFVGIVRKWYQDQHTVYVQARIKNLTMLYSVFTTTDKARKVIEKQLGDLRDRQKNADDERRWMK